MMKQGLTRLIKHRYINGMNQVNALLQKACDLTGSQAALARILRVTPAYIHQLVKGSRPIPPEKCVAIERATGGAVTRRDLRPDDWQDIWPELVCDCQDVEPNRPLDQSAQTVPAINAVVREAA
jgi:DNA-binding transcriptional regulator YdaS (Cro superfamily)